MTRPAIFLDRDGVLVQDNGYVHRVEELQLLAGVVAGLRRFQQAGYLLVVVTNQSGIARGLYTEDDYQRFTRALRQRLSDQGVTLDTVLHCPHLPEATVPAYALDCSCRKPRPGMLLRAVNELGIDPARSLMVGDRESDMEAGYAAGVARNFLIHAGTEQSPTATLADGVFADLDSLATHFFQTLSHEH